MSTIENRETLVSTRPARADLTRWWQSAHVRTGVIVGLLFLAAWLPRAFYLDAFVTPDEPKWLSRSANFYYAMSDGDLTGTFQREHPGVTITWLGMFAFQQRLPDYPRLAPGHMIDLEFERWLHESTNLHPLDLLVAGRWWVVLAVSLATAAAFIPLRALLGPLVAGLAALTLAWDPFFIALSRQLHPDGLLAILTLLAFLTFLAWLVAGRGMGYLLASGVLGGLALLTKTSAIFLLPAAGLLVLAALVAEMYQTRRIPWRLIGASLGWLGLVGVTYVALWPVMWIEPVDVLLRITVQMQKYQAVGHNLPNYFLGEITWEPGAWFYPVVLLLRSTPLTLIGALLAVAWLLLPVRPRPDARRRETILALLGFMVIFILGTTLVAKKFDRYILPAFLALDVLAVLGWVGLAEVVLRQRVDALSPRASGRLLALGAAAILLLHGLPGFLHAPYYLTYYNPLAGGTRTAPRMLMVGWGEGLDQAAKWVREQSGDEPARVATWYLEGPTSYFLDVDDKSYGYYPSPGFWFEADYAILYVNQWQRDNPSQRLIDYFFSREPAFVAQKRGLELARVYDLRNTPPPDFTHIRADAPVTFADQLRLAAHRLPVEAVYPGDAAEITLFHKRVAPVEENYLVELRLLDADGGILWRDQRWPAGIPTSSWPIDTIQHDVYNVQTPPALSPGAYPLSLTFLTPDGEQALPITEGAARTAADGGYLVTTLQVQAPSAIAIDAVWAPVQLHTIRHQPTLQPGQTLVTEIDAVGETNGAWKISLRLVDATGDVVAQLDKTVEPTMRFQLDLPADLASGEYALSAVIYDPATLAPLPDQHGAFATQLSVVTVGS
jgi:hypothetical protein